MSCEVNRVSCPVKPVSHLDLPTSLSVCTCSVHVECIGYVGLGDNLFTKMLQHYFTLFTYWAGLLVIFLFRSAHRAASALGSAGQT
jgi:hypothetical protein